MKLAILKKARVVISLVFFLLTLFIFIDFAGLISVKLIRAVLYLQFIPSFLEFISALTLASAGFLFIVLITLLFGRVYCSTLCPLGTLLDISLWFRNRIKKKKFRYRKEQVIVRYSILAAGLILLFFSNIFIINLLDPFGISGKIFSNLARFAYYFGNDLLALLLKTFDNYFLYPVPIKYVHLSSIIVSSLMLVILAGLAVSRGRLYCNTICPAGTFLGFLSKFSLFRLKIDDDHCNSCGLCTRDCKGECIDFKEQFIDFSRCVACYNCIRSCPENGISYRMAINRVKTEETNAAKEETSGFNRRAFLKTTLAGAGSVMAAKLAFSETPTRAISLNPVTPPGSVSIWNFTSKCTSCHLCVSVCPTHVLQPTVAEFGLAGLFQPKMDYHTNYCNFECIKCAEICPSGAIQQITKEQKETIQLGVSKFIKNLCVVVEKHTACAACSEHCPTKAVEMVPYLDNLKIPQVDEKICVGCGACEYACPTKPDKAIFVESNTYHRKAFKPPKKVEDKTQVKPQEDFPF